MIQLITAGGKLMRLRLSLYFICRFCHDEAVTNHTLDRQKVREIECLLCFTRQTVSNECIDQNCRTKFGDKYFCGICKLYDDVDKGQFHCDGCGICRLVLDKYLLDVFAKTQNVCFWCISQFVTLSPLSLFLAYTSGCLYLH